jgi:selenocysteine-specific elongation factor
MARLSLLDVERLEPDREALARVTLRQPIGALSGDRFVVRDTAATRTIGGGAVLDPFPPRRGRRTPVRLAQLAPLAAQDPVEALRGLLSAPPGWTDAAGFFRSRNLTPERQSLVISATPAVAAGGLLMMPAAFSRVRDAVAAALEAHHRASPELPGLQAERLRLSLPDRLPATAFSGLVQTLLDEKLIAQDGPWLRLPEHRVTLSALDRRVWDAARPLIEADRFRPPRVRDFAGVLQMPEAPIRATLKRLQRLGQVLEIAPDHFFLRETVAEMASIAAGAVDQDGLLTAAAFRDRLNNGRKVAIQILEFFDKVGVTIRQGDMRRVRRDRLEMFGPAAGQMPG